MGDHFRAAISLEHSPDVGQMGMLARAIVLGGGDLQAAKEWAKGMPERVRKAVQAPMATTEADMAGLAYAQQILTAYGPMLRNSSVFFRLWNDEMMLRLPWQVRLSFLTGAVVGGVPGQSNAIAVTRVASDEVRIKPSMAVGIVVFTKEMVKWLTTSGETFLATELKRAITVAVDRGFLSLITDGSTPTRASLGTLAEDAIEDLGYLLDSCDLRAESKPLFVCAPDVAIKASTLYDNGRVFPEMGPMGGTLLNIPAMVSDSLGAGELGLIDGAGIAGDAEGFQIAFSREGTLQLNDTPDSPPTASTTMMNLWQHGLVGLKPEIFFGASRLRASAFAKVTGIAWGGVDSPA